MSLIAQGLSKLFRTPKTRYKKTLSDDIGPLPQHIAIIMDGNGRWASKRGLPRIAGHKKGVDVVKNITRAANDIGIKFLTLYTFSTENWKRPKDEVSGLMSLVEEVLTREIDELDRENVKLLIIGRRQSLPDSVRNSITRAEERTKNNTGLCLLLALNYGGRAEIIDAVKEIAQEAADGRLIVSALDEKTFQKRLYTGNIPDPDLLIRTGGDLRVSNFLLWQIAYSEIWVTSSFWPDFTPHELERAIEEFQQRERRYGGAK